MGTGLLEFQDGNKIGREGKNSVCENEDEESIVRDGFNIVPGGEGGSW